MSDDLVKAAVVQAGSVLFDSGRTLDKLERLAREAAKKGARIIVFPEAFIGGYPKGHHFGAPVGSRSAEGRDMFRRYWEGAISADGPETKRLAALARELQTDMVVGVVEKGSQGDGGATLYCAAFIYSADGRCVGRRRKVMPTAAERLLWGYGDGADLAAFDLRSGKASAVICWENYMPLLRMSQYAQGAEFYCAPTVDDRDNWSAAMRMIAVEGRCFVLSACQFMRRSDAPEDFHPVQGDAPETVLINGGSVIISPMGQILAGPVYGEETILYADCDRRDIIRGKMDFDVAGHYARPDLFTLTVHRSRQSAVAFKCE